MAPLNGMEKTISNVINTMTMIASLDHQNMSYVNNQLDSRSMVNLSATRFANQKFRTQLYLHYADLDERDVDMCLAFKLFFYAVYVCIFVVGLTGNLLVCYVVFKQSSMHTVTNIYIANLAMADILLCLFAVPFTPLYLLAYQEWIFGSIFCHLVPFAQGMSVYISVFTLMSIAIERYLVIVHPFQRSVALTSCVVIICSIWLLAFVLTLPYGVFIDVIPVILITVPTKEISTNDTVTMPSRLTDSKALNGTQMASQAPADRILSYLFRSIRPKFLCDEMWPNNSLRIAFGVSTCVIQFVVPFCIIAYCYIKVCLRLWNRIRTRPGNGNCSSQRKWYEKERARRTNMMLIFMVVIFVVSWLPLNTYNLIEDFYIPVSYWRHSRTLFMLFHVIAMSSTCYNPFLYAWLNDNFRKEFKSIFVPLCNHIRWLLLHRCRPNGANMQKDLQSSVTGGIGDGGRCATVGGGGAARGVSANGGAGGGSGGGSGTRKQNSKTKGDKCYVYNGTSHSRDTKNATKTTRLDASNGGRPNEYDDDDEEEEGECISMTMLDTTTNLVTNMESINEVELQQSLLATSVRNAVYATTNNLPK